MDVSTSVVMTPLATDAEADDALEMMARVVFWAVVREDEGGGVHRKAEALHVGGIALEVVRNLRCSHGGAAV